MHRWGGLDSLRAQNFHVCNQQNYYKKAFFRMYVTKNPNPRLARFTTSWKTGNTLRKTIKMIIIFFIVILLVQMLWLNEYFLSIIFYRLDLQGKNIREEPKGIVFLSKLLLLFQFCTCASFQNPNFLYHRQVPC